MSVLTWLAVDDDALLMVGVAGRGQLFVQHVLQLSQLSSLPLPSPWLFLTWLTVDDDALLKVVVAGGGQLFVQHDQQLSRLSSLPLLILWQYSPGWLSTMMLF